MNQEKNDMKEYLEKRGKATSKNRTEKAGSSLQRMRSKSLELLSYVKKWGYKLAKMTLFAFFVYKIEANFSKMRVHIARNGGLRKQGMGQGY